MMPFAKFVCLYNIENIFAVIWIRNPFLFCVLNIFYSCSLSLQYYTEPSLSKKAINKPITLKENHDTMFQTFGLLEGTMNGRFFASFCSTKNKQQSGVGMM